MKSVTKIKEFYCNQFNAELVARILAKKNKQTPEYYLTLWEEKSKKAREKGTQISEFAEKYPSFPSPKLPEEMAVANWFGDTKYQVFAQECKIVSEDLGIVGKPDTVLVNPETGGFIVQDFKTSINLHKNYNGQKLRHSLKNYFDTPLTKYMIQLNLYKVLIEHEWGEYVEDMIVTWVGAESEPHEWEIGCKNNYIDYRVPDITKFLLEDIKSGLHETQ